MSRPIFRFAPSPNGLLHLGHAYSALLNARMAEECGGRLLLRIEDTDETRCKPEFVSAIFEDLAWLGLHWEEPVRIQSAHFSDYEANLALLAADSSPEKISPVYGRGAISIPVSVQENRLRPMREPRAIQMASHIMGAPADACRAPKHNNACRTA